jgi:hypothetical protein
MQEVRVDPNLYVEKVTQAANAVTAFAAVQSIAFAIALLSGTQLASTIVKATWAWTYLPACGGVCVYWLLVAFCWWQERKLLGNTAVLQDVAFNLMLGRLVVILGAGIPVILAMAAVRASMSTRLL